MGRPSKLNPPSNRKLCCMIIQTGTTTLWNLKLRIMNWPRSSLKDLKSILSPWLYSLKAVELTTVRSSLPKTTPLRKNSTNSATLKRLRRAETALIQKPPTTTLGVRNNSPLLKLLLSSNKISGTCLKSKLSSRTIVLTASGSLRWPLEKSPRW